MNWKPKSTICKQKVMSFLENEHQCKGGKGPFIPAAQPIESSLRLRRQYPPPHGWKNDQMKSEWFVGLLDDQ